MKRLREDVTQHPLTLHHDAHPAEDDRHHAERTADPDGEEIFEILIAMIVRMIVIVRVFAMIVLFQFDGHEIAPSGNRNYFATTTAVLGSFGA